MAVIRVPLVKENWAPGEGNPVLAWYVVADTEAERPTGLTGDLCFTKDTNKLWKYHGSAWNETAGSGTGSGVQFREFTITGAGWVVSNMPLAATELGGGDFRIKADLSQFTEVRFVSRVAGGTFVAGMTLKAQYSTDESAWADLTATVASNAAGTKVTAWEAIPDPAKADVFLRVVSAGGNGTADPRIGTQAIQVR